VTYSIFYSFNYLNGYWTAEVISGRFKAQAYTSILYAEFEEAFKDHCNSCRNDFLGWGTTSYYTYFRQAPCDSTCDTYLTQCAPCNFAFLAQCAAVVGMDPVTEYRAHNGALGGAAVVDTGILKEWVCP